MRGGFAGAALLALAGCNIGGGGDTGFQPDSTGESGDAASSSSSGGAGSGGAASTGGAETDGPKLDVGGPDVPPATGCDKIDFVFVIDDSQSMEDEQANLIANFPAFINAIETARTDVDDFHVGIVTTEVYPYNAVQCRVLGGLVVQTGGVFSSAATCGPYTDGGNFMTSADDIPASFSCAAQVGAGGSNLERPMDALMRVVDGVHAGPGDCNEDFLRDDALLVVVIVTDEWDGPDDPDGGSSSGDPQSWYDAVVAAKGGKASNAAVVSLIQVPGGPCPPPNATQDGQHIAEFTELFGDHGFVGGLCLPDYGELVLDAAALVDGACQDFEPPG